MTNRYICVKDHCNPCMSKPKYKGGKLKELEIGEIYYVIFYEVHISSMAFFMAYSQNYYSRSISKENPLYVVIIEHGKFLCINESQKNEMFEEITLFRNRKINEILSE